MIRRKINTKREIRKIRSIKKTKRIKKTKKPKKIKKRMKTSSKIQIGESSNFTIHLCPNSPRIPTSSTRHQFTKSLKPSVNIKKQLVKDSWQKSAQALQQLLRGKSTNSTKNYKTCQNITTYQKLDQAEKRCFIYFMCIKLKLIKIYFKV